VTPELRQRIVLVRAHFASPSKTIVGTGFRLSPRLVLTSQHVVFQAKKKANRIEVEAVLAGESIARAPATLLWTGEKDLRSADPKARDVGLLADELPGTDLEPFRDFVWHALGDEDWTSAGFALFASGYRVRSPTNLFGTVGAIRQLEAFLNLHVGRLEPAEEREVLGWGGISGAPVFVRSGVHRGRLYGVVRRGAPNQPDTLLAVPLPVLLRDEGFCKHLGIELGEGNRADLVTTLRKLLREEPTLGGWIAEADESFAEAQEHHGLDGLVDAMNQKGGFEDVLERLAKIFEAKARGDEKRRSALRRAASLLTSLIAGRAYPCQCDDPTGQHVSIHATSPNLAEPSLAAYDGGDSQFVRGAGSRVAARFRAQLPQVDAGPGDEQAHRDQQELLHHFLFNEKLRRRPWLGEDWLSFLDSFEGNPPDEKRAHWVEALRTQMRRILKDHGRRPYVIVDHEFRAKFGPQADAFLDQLAIAFSDLRQVELSGATIDRFREDDLLKPLWKILDLKEDDDRDLSSPR